MTQNNSDDQSAGLGMKIFIGFIAFVGAIVLGLAAVAVVVYFSSDSEPFAVLEELLRTQVSEKNMALTVSTANGEELAAPTTPADQQLGTSNLYIEYILDGSGSMNDLLPDGTVKIEVARKVLLDHVATFRPETNIGLRAYGHRVDWQEDEIASCQDIQAVAPIAKGQVERIVTWLDEFEAKGMTPIYTALEQSLASFVYDPARINSIILLSDGMETCSGDPCGLVRDLKAQGINFTVHVIGLDVDAATRAQLSCIAEVAGGVYQDAHSEEDLVDVLNLVGSEVANDEIITAVGDPTPSLAHSSESAVMVMETSVVTVPPQDPMVKVNVASANIRSGPGVHYSVVGFVLEGDTLDVLGKDSTGSWFNVHFDNPSTGWIAASVVDFLNPDLLPDVPIASTIPAPPPTDAPPTLVLPPTGAAPPSSTAAPQATPHPTTAPTSTSSCICPPDIWCNCEA